MAECLHCSSPTNNDDKFCCHGCESVYQLIHDQGMEQFYELKADQALQPANETPFQKRDYSWLETIVHQCESEQPDGASVEYAFGVSGMTCLACIWLIEKSLMNTPGVLYAVADSKRGKLDLTWESNQTDLVAIAATLQSLGYELLASPSRTYDQRTNLNIRLGVTGALAMNSMAFTLPKYTGIEASSELAELFTIIAVASATLAFLVGGSYFFKRAWTALKLKCVHMDLPISLGLIIAYIGSMIGWLMGDDSLFYFDFVAIFSFLMLLGKQLQLNSLDNASSRFTNQCSVPDMWFTPEQQTVATEDLRPLQRICIPPGTVIPAEATLEDEAADISLAWITGEPTSKAYERTAVLPAGSVNQSSHPITVSLRSEVDADSRVQKVFELAQQTTESQRSPRSSKIIQGYLLVILFLGLAAGAFWLHFSGSWITALQVVISVYVVSCPCGIGLALPLLESSTNKKAHAKGIFPLSGDFWAQLGKITRLVFDKTGTLTLDRPSLSNADQIDSLSSAEREALNQLTQSSQHPLSRSLFSQLIARGHLPTHSDGELSETPGQGIAWKHDGEAWSLGRPGWMSQEPQNPSSSDLCCEFRKNGMLIQRFTFEEAARSGTRQALEQCARFFKQPATILSGDASDRVNSIAENVGISEAHGGLLPEQKEALVSQFESEGNILYLGDGANDLPALQKASLAGAPFNNVNLLTNNVDFLFTDESLEFLPNMIRLKLDFDHRRKRLIFWTVTYNTGALIACVCGMMSPLVAAFIMPISSLISSTLVTGFTRKQKAQKKSGLALKATPREA